jgi:hypothetical protein
MKNMTSITGDLAGKEVQFRLPQQQNQISPRKANGRPLLKTQGKTGPVGSASNQSK